MIQYKIFSLPNGIDVLYLKRPEQYSVYADILVHAGSVYETDASSGVSHFFEHLLFDGTKTYPSEQQIRNREQELGLSVGASTNVSSVHVRSSFPKNELRNSLLLLKEMVYESLMKDEAITKERGVILDEQRQRRDGKGLQLWEFMVTHLFGKSNPLSFSPGGTIEAVTEMKPAVVRDFYKTHVTSRNSSIVIGGNFEESEIQHELESIFQAIPQGKKVSEPTYDNSTIQSGQIVSLVQEGNQQYFSIAFPSYAGDDLFENTKHNFVYRLLSEELNRKLRIEEGVLYNISVGGYRPVRNLALTMIDGSCNPKDFGLVVERIHACIRSIKKDGFEKGMFDRIRTAGNNTMPMQFDTLSGAMSWATGTFHHDRKIFLPDEVLKARNQITEKDIVDCIQTIFTTKDRTFATLGPLPEEIVNHAVSVCTLEIASSSIDNT